MTLEEIQAIIRQINDSDIREINLDYQDIHLYLNKNENSHQTAETVSEKPAPTESSPEKLKTAQSAVKSEKPETEPAKQEATAIKAPLVGVIYLQPSPDKPAYKKVGDHVSAGEVVCVIEAMKMMTEIKSKVDGTISKILVENEEVVEYDQPLFEVTK
ncbi:acetyl-CoA carboxylase, biotin carboxyl carrier protein [Secundilactobacillus pentosiphilus]|uniref:Biotin carboxyl carrier protein of acetyl-CoA carboxylase n=1 Tax=Secundilactobacillus pentosiphilus TaxID=1714682 RepID=A0A1Z5ILS8_9LACO|nr:acetyl-CoA carboxylase biotin carboxyl carrier protein [Secundilactobacillus pentosiphilus]GAX02725.1 acetyl-CoA carboxylase, biotin carboxyl carrier protein [Secundilactobacillus pentosiphilus]